MRASARNRRSERYRTVHRALLDIEQPAPIREIAVTDDVSLHGARVLARRKLPSNARGSLELIGSGRRVPCRVTWQDHKPDADGRMFTGVEIFTNSNFWAISFGGAEFEAPAAAQAAAAAAAQAAPAASPTPPAGAARPAIDPSSTVVQALSVIAAKSGEQAAIRLWSSLVDVLEAKNVVSRDELIASLRKLAK